MSPRSTTFEIKAVPVSFGSDWKYPELALCAAHARSEAQSSLAVMALCVRGLFLMTRPFRLHHVIADMVRLRPF